jgi:hypothetical protein
MPIQSDTCNDETDECDLDSCVEEYRIGHAVGGFCSMGCLHRNKGAGVLRKIRFDHRWCATCFRPIKEVSRPPNRWVENKASKVQAALDAGAEFKAVGGDLTLDASACESARPTAVDAVIGTQYQTEHTVWATDDVGEGLGNRRLRQRWACECGNIDPSHRDQTLEDVELDQLVARLFWCLEDLEAEGTIHRRPDKGALFSSLREAWRDWELAVGRALQ